VTLAISSVSENLFLEREPVSGAVHFVFLTISQSTTLHLPPDPITPYSPVAGNMQLHFGFTVDRR